MKTDRLTGQLLMMDGQNPNWDGQNPIGHNPKTPFLSLSYVPNESHGMTNGNFHHSLKELLELTCSEKILDFTKELFSSGGPVVLWSNM